MSRRPTSAGHTGARPEPAHRPSEDARDVSVGTAFHPATAPLNRKQQWREWSGYFASSAYADAHDIEYNAIREAAALIDVSPLYKYVVGGPDAQRLVDRVITRDATKLTPGQGLSTRRGATSTARSSTTARSIALDDGTFRWTAADPQLRWLRMNAPAWTSTSTTSPSRPPRSRSRARSRATCSRPRPAQSFADLALLPAARRATVKARPPQASRSTSRGPATPATSATSCGSTRTDAVALWDALWAAGADHGIRPAGMLALDVVRLEAGLILLEVDYTSARHAMNPEQNYSPAEIGLGRLVSLRQGRLRRAARAASGSARPAARRAGSSACSSTGTASRACSAPRACRRRSRRSSTGRRGRSSSAAARSAGRRRSAGARSSSRRSPSPRCRRRTRRSGPTSTSSGPSRAAAAGSRRTVVALPFLDLERKRA